MIENSYPVLERFEPLHTDAAEAPWVEVRGKRILLVEDEVTVRACLRMMLELEGHQVAEAGNGAEALTLLASGHFDLVITDFEMPVMKGNQLAIGIKRLAPSLPVLMITASVSARRDAENPVDALLNKPFMVTDLNCAITKLMSPRPEPAQPSVVPTQWSPSLTFVPEGAACCPTAGVAV
jgi:two-component system, cell cycle response regulator CpdR